MLAVATSLSLFPSNAPSFGPTKLIAACDVNLNQENCGKPCYWMETNTCFRGNCYDYSYGCQDGAFCGFTKGPKIIRQMQCNFQGFPCKWNGRTCQVATARPSRGLDTRTCSDSCHFAHNGICEDGGVGSLTYLCEYATDCADCGIRRLK